VKNVGLKLRQRAHTAVYAYMPLPYFCSILHAGVNTYIDCTHVSYQGMRYSPANHVTIETM